MDIRGEGTCASLLGICRCITFRLLTGESRLGREDENDVRLNSIKYTCRSAELLEEIAVAHQHSMQLSSRGGMHLLLFRKQARPKFKPIVHQA
jgi:hypothetical protein